MKTAKHGHFFGQTLKIWWRHAGFLLRLSFTLLFQLGLGLGLAVGGYFYRQNLTWWLVALVIWLVLSFFAMTLYGVGKNIAALLRGQGQDRYPLLSLSYLNRGWQMLFILGLFVALMLVVAAMVFAWRYFHLPYGELGVLLTVICWLYPSWRLSLVLPLLVLRQDSFWMCWRQSWHLVHKRPNLVAGNFFIGLIAGIIGIFFPPVLGIFAAVSWFFLSNFNLAYKLMNRS